MLRFFPRVCLFIRFTQKVPLFSTPLQEISTVYNKKFYLRGGIRCGTCLLFEKIALLSNSCVPFIIIDKKSYYNSNHTHLRHPAGAFMCFQTVLTNLKNRLLFIYAICHTQKVKYIAKILQSHVHQQLHILQLFRNIIFYTRAKYFIWRN